jgi:8-oxo-dGTP diphosphatase
MRVLEEAEAVMDIKLAAAIVLHPDPSGQDRVLVVRRSEEETFLPRIWGVPCGKVEDSEEPRDAAVRELREETGLAGKVVRAVGTLEFWSQWRGKSARNIQSNYLMRLKHAHKDTDPDGMPLIRTPQIDQESKWLTLNEIGQAGLDDHNLQAIRQALACHGMEANSALARRG